MNYALRKLDGPIIIIMTELKVDNLSHNKQTFAPLYQYFHMHDQDSTQIFTFIILPHLLCSSLEEVQSNPFLFAQHWWILRFLKSTTHLGVFLEFLSTFSQTTEECDLKRANSNTAKHVQWETVTLDFQFTLKNQEHFSKNESYVRHSCVFSIVQPRHGKRRFIELNDLTSKHYLFDDGRCLFELELKKAEILLNLWSHQCKDPIYPHTTNTNDAIEAVNIARMDGTMLKLSRSMHFETNYFFYSGSLWFLTLDIELCKNSKQERNTSEGEDSLVIVDVEVSLVRHVPRTRPTQEKPKCSWNVKQQSHNYRVQCSAVLPGNCATGLMDFNIGSQGWPMKAHRIRFPRYSAPDSQKLHNQNTDCSEPGDADIESTRTLLLSVGSSPINVSLKMISFSRIAFVEVPVPTENENTPNTLLTDPYDLYWKIRIITVGRVLRLQLQPIARTPSVRLGHSLSDETPTTQYSTSSISTLVLGMELQLNPLDQRLRKPIHPVNATVAHLARPFEDALQSRQRLTDSIYANELRNSVFETVMDITVEEALEQSSGLVNPLNGTILVKITWVYGQLLYPSRIQSVDTMIQRQHLMMKDELNRIRKERDELERQLMITKMGLIQVGRSGDTRPQGLLPQESLSAAGNLFKLGHDSAPDLIRASDRRAALTGSSGYLANRNEHSKYEESFWNSSVENIKSNHGIRLHQNSDFRKQVVDYHVHPQTSLESDLHAQFAIQKEPKVSDSASVKMDNSISEFNERKKQFIRTKTKWQTYDNYSLGRTPEGSRRGNNLWCSPIRLHEVYYFGQNQPTNRMK